MTQVDYVVVDTHVIQTSKFNMDDLYQVFKKWFNDNNYFIKEKEYGDMGGGNFKIKWDCRKDELGVFN